MVGETPEEMLKPAVRASWALQFDVCLYRNIGEAVDEPQDRRQAALFFPSHILDQNQITVLYFSHLFFISVLVGSSVNK